MAQLGLEESSEVEGFRRPKQAQIEANVCVSDLGGFFYAEKSDVVVVYTGIKQRIQHKHYREKNSILGSKYHITSHYVTIFPTFLSGIFKTLPFLEEDDFCLSRTYENERKSVCPSIHMHESQFNNNNASKKYIPISHGRVLGGPSQLARCMTL